MSARPTGEGARRRALAALGLLAVLGAAPAEARRHRLHLPPPPGASLPSAIAVDEREWSVRASHATVAAGPVSIAVYNRGMDDHDLTIERADGTVAASLAMPTRTRSALQPTLAPGRYKLFCSLFAGTPQSHELAGMVTYLDVR